MSNAADVIRPPGSTHVAWCYGSPSYYKRVESRHLNQVSEEWQTLTKWFEWSFLTMTWCAVEAGFCSRRIKPVVPEKY